MQKPRQLAAAILTATLSVCAAESPASAGGYDELPDQGAQALGRGATFTAKADDATALYYNVAGLARQRGTSVQISGNLQIDNFSFARAGNYPDSPTDPATPWGGKRFPVATDKNASFLLPMMVATTDLGIFDRLTFGVGVWGPSAAGRTFPLGINGQPSPTRYDYIQSNGLVLFPTLGAGYRLTDKIDIGLAGHLVIASVEEFQIAYTDPGGGVCKNPEYVLCDTQGRAKVKGTGFAASAGILARPHPEFQLGAQVKTPWSVKATGTADATLGSGTTLPTEPLSVGIQFPWILRAGARYIGLRPRAADAAAKTFEAYDLELDATYETWSSAGNPGPIATTIDPTTNKPTSVPEIHNYKDTVSLRGGGAYNIDLDGAVLSLRAGAYYESPTTDSAYTRVDVDTMAKVGGTVGLGYKRGAFSFNFAYAAIESIGRDVTDGAYRPSNSEKNGQAVDGDGKPLPAVNNGSYRAFTNVLSFSVEVNFEALFTDRKKSTFGDPAYEDVARGRDPEPKHAAKPAEEPSLTAAALPPSVSSPASSSTTADTTDAAVAPPSPDARVRAREPAAEDGHDSWWNADPDALPPPAKAQKKTGKHKKTTRRTADAK